MNDPNSRVSEVEGRFPLNYTVLGELNVKPRTHLSGQGEKSQSGDCKRMKGDPV